MPVSPQGRHDRFIQVAKDHQAAVFRYCLALSPDRQAAEDALQETFLAAFRSFDSFRGDSSVRTWLFTIARRVSFRLTRKRAGEPGAFEELQDLGARAGWGQPPTPEGKVLIQERRQQLRDALAQLSERDREVVVLRDLEELTVRETAQVTGASEAAVRTRLHRARLKFIALLREGDAHHAD